MGGLAARRYLASHGARRVACLVTIASPHAGTVLARLALGANALQMRPGSAFLRELVQVENGNAPCPATSIYSWQDNLVMPQDTSRLPWARNIALESMGHITILQSPRVFATVLEALRDAGVRDRDDP
jgi:triacylglycerol esterase/lipase EstA (alpha/beta hydrolase family)